MQILINRQYLIRFFFRFRDMFFISFFQIQRCVFFLTRSCLLLPLCSSKTGERERKRESVFESFNSHTNQSGFREIPWERKANPMLSSFSFSQIFSSRFVFSSQFLIRFSISCSNFELTFNFPFLWNFIIWVSHCLPSYDSEIR